MTVMNYTTKVSAEKTIGEMQKLLANAGAARISLEYAGGRAAGMSFLLVTPHGERTFNLPVDIEAMRVLLGRKWNSGQLRSMSYAKITEPEHAERVAWRVMKDWLAAQLTLVATQMATLDQVMLPYLNVAAGRTLYQAYKDSENTALELGVGRG